MKETIIDIVKILLPILLSAIATFLVTKYKYNKNIPLDKLEIAYNRVYYPVYRIITDNQDCKEIETIIEKIKPYFIKNKKYIDSTTLYSFNSLCNNESRAKKKSLYKTFRANIQDRNSYLRKRLGYLESNMDRVYKYSDPELKLWLRMAVEAVIIYIFSNITPFLKKDSVPYEIISIIGSILILIMVCQFVRYIIMKVYYFIKR